MLKAFADSLQAIWKPCNGDHKEAIWENWGKEFGSNISKIYT